MKTPTRGPVVWEVVLPRVRSSWTVAFERVPGWTPPQGVPETYAVNFSHQLIGADIRVEVAVRNPGHRIQTEVATVTVSPGQRVLVEQLRNFGVEPIELSNIAVAPMTPFSPTAISASPDLEISRVDVLTTPLPGYRVTLRNLSSRAVASVHLQTWRGDQKSLSSMPRGPQGKPLVEPGGSYALEIPLTAGSYPFREVVPPQGASPVPLDVIAIDAVNWEDGTADGKPPYPWMAQSIANDAGRALQLERVIAILREAQQHRGNWSDVLDVVRTRLEALAAADTGQLAAAQEGMSVIKRTALDDLRRYEAIAGLAHSMDDVREWLQFTLARYEGWLRTSRHEPERR